jgi:RNA polymerase sigma-70 factor (ECF subfamily)
MGVGTSLRRSDSSTGRGEELLASVYAEHAGPLLRYVLRLVDDRGLAEDIVQESMLRAWRHADRLEVERLGPWLRTVARNLVVDTVRARRARPPETGDEGLALVPDAGVDFDRALETWQLGEALQGLTPAHREVLVEVFYRGRSVAEAARALGVPPGTVKSRTYYALRSLRLALEEQGVTGA